jgi:hypothetical protein
MKKTTNNSHKYTLKKKSNEVRSSPAQVGCSFQRHSSLYQI